MACLDTSFMIDLLDGDERARETMDRLDEEGMRHAVTPVSAGELYVGAHAGSAVEFRRATSLLESLRWLAFDRSCARRAGEIQATLLDRGEPIAVTDCFIAAMAIEHDEPLVTRDDDFERIDDLRLVSYR